MVTLCVSVRCVENSLPGPLKCCRVHVGPVEFTFRTTTNSICVLNALFFLPSPRSRSLLRTPLREEYFRSSMAYLAQSSEADLLVCAPISEDRATPASVGSIVVSPMITASTRPRLPLRDDPLTGHPF